MRRTEKGVRRTEKGVRRTEIVLWGHCTIPYVLPTDITVPMSSEYSYVIMYCSMLLGGYFITNAMYWL